MARDSRSEEHFEPYVREYDERREARVGSSLRRVVLAAVEAYLASGRLEGGFARIRWPGLPGRAPARPEHASSGQSQ